MSERATISIEIRSPIGRVLMLQVLSAIMILGSIAEPTPTIHFSGIISIGLVQIGLFTDPPRLVHGINTLKS